MEFIKHLVASDIPFARDDAHRMLPAMIACLIGFAALLLALSVSLSNSVTDTARDVTGVLQVEVPKDTAAKKDAMERVVTTLRNAKGVNGVTVLREAEMEALLKPWLGSEFSLGDLPVPSLIDVKTDVSGGRSTVDLASLKRELSAIDRDIAIEDRGPWVKQMARATALLQSLVIFVAALLLACVIGMIVLVARTNLKLHFKAVSLLHMFGATDEYILRQFQWNNAALAARGAVVGSIFAALIFLAWVLLSHRWESPVLPPITFSIGHAFAFLLLPVLTALIAFLATRLTVQSMLRHMP